MTVAPPIGRNHDTGRSVEAIAFGYYETNHI